MENKKIVMRSNVAASNLLQALHSLYQSGHFCDVTVHTDHLGIPKEFSVHKAVLAASSNYFKNLFLNDKMLDTTTCEVTLQDVHTEEFISFLKFVYTTELEIEVNDLHRMKKVAERLECKDLLDVFEDVKAVSKKDLGLRIHLKRRETGEPLWNHAEPTEDKEPIDSSQILGAPMEINLWDREQRGKLSPSHDITEDKAGPSCEDSAAFAEKRTSTRHIKVDVHEADNINTVSHKENHSRRSVLRQESCKEISKSLVVQTEGENSSVLEETQLRKSPRQMAKVLPQTYTCDKCNCTFHFAKQFRSPMELEHNMSLVVKYSCNACDRLFSSYQSLRQHRLAVHHKGRHFPCLLCDKKFKRQNDVNDHMRRVHEQKWNPQRCPYCDKVISSKCGPTGEKPYKCTFCASRFAQRSALNTHVRKIHESKQERKLMPGYWMIAPPVEIADITDSDIDRKIDQVSNTDLQRESVGERIPDFEGDCITDAESDNEEEREEESVENIAKRGKANDHRELVVEDSVKGEEERACQPDIDASKDHEVNENYKIRKGNTDKVIKKSAYVIACNKCAETFISRKKYVDHCKEVHHSLPGKVYQCDLCSKSFASYNSWKEHSACVHTEDRQFACTLCNATFKRKRDVRTHYVRKHEGRVKRPLCSVCGKILSSRTALVFHMRTHTGEKPYQCDVCCSRFAQPSQLKIHTRSHTGEKPYICEDCGACFTDKGKLNGHKRTHTGERLFECDVCRKHFATNEYLKCHKLCHLGAKPYKCEVCGKTFGLRASLAQHANVHAETPPYFCEQCGKTFTQQGALRRHQRIHTGEKPYKCKACERTFTDMSTLRRHVLIHDRNAHWRTFLIDLTIKKDHNWSKIETLSNICGSEDSAPVGPGGQGKPYKPKSLSHVIVMREGKPDLSLMTVEQHGTDPEAFQTFPETLLCGTDCQLS